MDWIRDILSPEEQISVSEMVRQAEMKTSGEIVPMIVRRSGNIPGVPVSLQKYAWVRRLFVNRQSENDAVWRRAIVEFESLKIKNTKDRSGILIFVSYFERRAVVLGDEAIHRLIPEQAWDELLTALTTEMKQGQVVIGFQKAIAMSGEILHKYFPIQQNDQNELKNHLVIKE